MDREQLSINSRDVRNFIECHSVACTQAIEDRDIDVETYWCTEPSANPALMPPVWGEPN